MRSTIALLVVSVVLVCIDPPRAEAAGSHPHRPATFLRRRVSPERTGFLDIVLRGEEPRAGAAIGISPGKLCARNGTFTVSWQGMPKPAPQDMIAIYSPANSTVHDYLDYIMVQDTHPSPSGSGSVDIVLLNMRTDYQVRYLSNGDTLVASSNVVSVCSIPMHAHLSLTGNPTEMRLGFVSSQPYTPMVFYGFSPNSLTLSATGKTTTYTADDMCNQPANKIGARLFRDPGFMQDVLMEDLPVNTRVYYQFGAADGSEISESTYSFMTAPPVGSVNTTTIMVYGDMGDGVLTPDARGTAERALQHVHEMDFILHIGDISYARSIGWVWDEFFNLIYNFATQIPYMVGIGNHEYDHTGGVNKDPSGASGTGFHPVWGNFGDDSEGECGVPMFYRFHMPDNGNSLFWYSFNYGNVHILHMSTEHDYFPTSEQYAWMEKDLAAVDRSVTPWVILAGHRPMYTSEDYPGDFKVSQNMQIAFEDLLHTYNVDMAVWGHYHAYERTCAVYKQQCFADGTGTTHIVVGTAGAELDDVDWYPEVWSLNHANQFGYGKITVNTDDVSSTTSLKWEFFFNSNDVLFDSVTISKPLPLEII